MAGAANDGGEHGPGGIVPGEASLHQAGAVVAHERGGLVLVTHGLGCVCGHRAPGLSLRAGRQPRAVAVAGPGLTWAGCGLRTSGRERGSRSSPGHSWPPRPQPSLLSRRAAAATGPQECGPGRPHIWASGPARPRPGGAQRRRSWPRPR